MAILSRDDFFSRLQTRLSEDTTDEGIAFLEDMTDTYNDLEQRANGSGENWEQKYHDLDESWKKKYQHRFFSGSATSVPGDITTPMDDVEDDPEEITVDDLFERKE